jgi:hypothetical protein
MDAVPLGLAIILWREQFQLPTRKIDRYLH